MHERLKMHLWRIASNLLPTKVAMSRFATNIDAACCFCDHPVEFVIHFFWVCPLAWALWFGSEWRIKTDVVHIPDSFNLIKTLLEPLVELDIINRERFTLMGALMLDQIWKLRNRKMHEDMEVEMDAALRDLLARCKEFEDLKTSSVWNSQPSPRVVWSLPTFGYIKFNIDAAVGLTSSSIEVVARNWRWTMVLPRSKKVNTTIPLQAEAEALVWASHLAIELGVDKVVF